jgi:tRNA-intron endonuclease
MRVEESKKMVAEAQKVAFAEKMTLEQGETASKLLEQGYGTALASGKLRLSMLEAAYLNEKKKLTLTSEKGIPLSTEQIERKGAKFDKRFHLRMTVFSDLRQRGYVVKTGLKYGAEFVVYDKGSKPGQDHSRWVVYPVYEHEHFGWQEFCAKNRVAHTTQKRLLLAILSDDDEVTYYEARWVRP